MTRLPGRPIRGPNLTCPNCWELRQKILAGQDDHKAATRCLRDSIAKAQAQHALSLELRSAMTLTGLLGGEGGKIAEARRCVASVFERFTEGFETADLRVRFKT